MKKNYLTKQDSSQQPDKTGWIRKFCGKGIFSDIWKNRYIVLKGGQLHISEKEVKDEKRFRELVDLSDYEKCEELRKAKRRSKKNHSKFILLPSQQPGNTVPDLLFLAASPEEKESWIVALNAAISRERKRILDEVTVDRMLAHPTRDRVKIPHTRRLPTRGHLTAVASTSNSSGMLTLDLIQEDDVLTPEPKEACKDNLNRAQHSPHVQRSKKDPSKLLIIKETPTKPPCLTRKSESSWDCSERQSQTPQLHKNTSKKSRWASMDEILAHSEMRPPPHCLTSDPLQPTIQLQELITQKLLRTQDLLLEVREEGRYSPSDRRRRVEAQRLLEEAASTWSHARDVLEEVKKLRALYNQLDSFPSTGLSQSPNDKLNKRTNQWIRVM